jgi:hypothetical protein
MGDFMQSSSRKNPCPICDRNKDDKCRWSDDIIFCYFGDDFAPSENYSIGDVVDTGIGRWALVRKTAGFSGGSYCFIPHRPISLSTWVSRKERNQARDERVRLIKGLAIAFADLRAIYKFSLSAPLLECLTIQEFNSYKLSAQKSVARIAALIRFILKNRSSLGPCKREMTALRIWKKQAAYQLADFLRFEDDCLGLSAMRKPQP